MITPPYSNTPEELDRILRFLNDEDDEILDTTILQRHLQVSYDIQKKLIKKLSALTHSNTVLSKDIERLKDKKEQTFLEGNFKDHEAELHDTDLAKMAIFYLRRLNCRYNMEKVMHIIYLVYAVYLEKGTRIITEHPQAFSQGPWFWRAKSRLEAKNKMGKTILYADPDTSELKEINEKDSSVAAITKNIVSKYFDVDTKEMLCKSQPYLNNDQSHNGGKWNKVIPDNEIYTWQKSKANTT